MLKKKLPLVGLTIIGLLSLFLHWKIFHLDIRGHHSIRQAQTQINIQNFYRYDSNILNPRVNVLDKNLEPSIRRLEFPIMQWSIAMIFRITGESLLVTRIIIFLIGLTAVAGMFYLIQAIFNNVLVSLAGAFAFNFSPVIYFYTLNPMPDIFALSAAIWSLVFFFRFLKTEELKFLILSALFVSIGAAAKLPYIIFIAGPGLWWLQQFLRGKLNFSRAALIALIYIIILLPTIIWYAKVIPTWTNGLVGGILEEKITSAQIKDYLHYHMTKMFPKFLLGFVSLGFVVVGIIFLLKFKLYKNQKFIYLLTTALAVLFYWIYEFSRIEKVHDYYMMPFLPFLYLLAAGGIYYMIKFKFTQYAVIIMLLAMPFITPQILRDYWKANPDWLLGDAFVHQDDLQKAVPQGANCIFINDPTEHVLMYLTDKKGFVFWDDHLPAIWIDDLIRNDSVTYLYSDSRPVDENPEVIPFLDTLIIERGEFRVFKLKLPDQ